MTEDYVSFEVAKLLKEKGFPQEYDEYHSMVYNEEDYEDEYEVQRMVLQTQLVKAGTLSSYPVGVPEPKCYCPTLQLVEKWLREVHHIYIVIEPHALTGGIAYSYECKYWYKGHLYYPYPSEQHELHGKVWNTHEEALNEIINYILVYLI